MSSRGIALASRVSSTVTQPLVVPGGRRAMLASVTTLALLTGASP